MDETPFFVLYGFIIGVIILFMVYVWNRSENATRGGSLFTGFICGLIGGTVGGMVLALIMAAAGIITGYEPSTAEVYDFEIVAASDGSDISGRAYLFGGSIDTKYYYGYYRARPDGSYSQGRISTDRTRIFEQSRDDARIEVTTYNNRGEWWRYSARQHPTYKVYVPEGSIIRNFEFNLQG